MDYRHKEGQRMRRTILLAAAAALLLTACSKSEGSDVSSAKETEMTKASTASESGTSAAEPAQTDSLPEDKDSKALYDTKPISEAYLSGDTSKLDKFQLEIYDAAAAVIDQVITDGMTAVEKELAIHDWMVSNCHYDEQELDAIGEMQENSDNPHGFLIDHRGICSGYATSFQLLMDMVGIECLTIDAQANDDFEGVGAHAWNMVHLDGDWYFVDVTWDDPVPDSEGEAIHPYFNCDESYLLKHEHIWDIDAYPKGTGQKLSYANLTAADVAELDDLPELVEQKLRSGAADNYYIFKDAEELGLPGDDKLDEFIRTSPLDSDRNGWLRPLELAYNECGFRIWAYQLVEVERGIAVLPYVTAMN